MTKSKKLQLLKPIHHMLILLSKFSGLMSRSMDIASKALQRAAERLDPLQGCADMVELRDALTGEPLGLTKAQYRRYVLALGSKDPAQVARAVSEARARRHQVLLALATAACLVVIPGCTKANDALICTPGQQVACPCPDGAQGAQTCAVGGRSYTSCAGCGLTVKGGEPDMADPPDQATGTQHDMAQPVDGLTTAPSDLYTPPPPHPGITCGGVTCGPVGNNVACCETYDGTLTSTCDTSGTCPTAADELRMACDDASDCASDSYCGVDVGWEVAADQYTGGHSSCVPAARGVSFSPTTNGLNNTTTGYELMAPACKTTADCAAVTGTVHMSAGDQGMQEGFTACCHGTGTDLQFCSPPALADINGVTCD